MPSENAVQLSSAQKRDLLGMSAAAVITTALIAATIVLPHDSGVPPLVDPSIMTAEAVPVPLLVQAISPSTFDTRVTRPVAAPVSGRRRERPAPIARVPLVSRSMVATAPVLMAVNMPAARPAKPLGKRIAGLFTGDGTYSVRPFPTISTERN